MPDTNDEVKIRQEAMAIGRKQALDDIRYAFIGAGVAWAARWTDDEVIPRVIHLYTDARGKLGEARSRDEAYLIAEASRIDPDIECRQTLLDAVARGVKR